MSGSHPIPAEAALADRAQKLPLGGWLNEGRFAVILQPKLPVRTRQHSGHRCYCSFASHTQSFTLAIATAKKPLFDEERVSRIRHRCMAPVH